MLFWQENFAEDEDKDEEDQEVLPMSVVDEELVPQKMLTEVPCELIAMLFHAHWTWTCSCLYGCGNPERM